MAEISYTDLGEKGRMESGEEESRRSKVSPEEHEILDQQPLNDYPVNTSTGSFTSVEIQLLKRSMQEMITKGRRITARKLIVWMFLNIKGMAEKFPNYSYLTLDTLLEDERFSAHGIAVFMSLEQLVIILESQDQFQSKLADLARFHIHRPQGPVGSRYFKIFRNKFRFFLVEEFGTIPDKNVVLAWEKLLSKLVSAIKTEEDKHAPPTCCPLL